MIDLSLSAVLAAVVNGAIVSVFLAAAVWLLLRIAPRRLLNAATRYAIWWMALIAVIALPLLYLPLRSHNSDVSAISANFSPTESVQSHNGQENGSDLTSALDAAIEPVPLTGSIAVASPSSVPNFRFPIEVPATRALRLAGLAWVAIAALLLVRLWFAIIALRRRKVRAFAAPPDVSNRLNQWTAICGTVRCITVAVSPEIATPMAAGLRHPAILIPAALLTELDSDELDQIGLHETAHLARRDDFALIAQRVIEAMFALHPVVRWIARRIDLEREIACDDFVVTATGRPRPYAQCLTRVVELAGGSRESLIAAAATEEPSHLARRVEMLLDKKRNIGTRLLKVRLIGAVAALAMLLGIAAKTPGMIAFAMPPDAMADLQEPPLPPTPPVAPLPATPLSPRSPAIPPAPPAAPEPPPAQLAPFASAPEPATPTPAVAPRAPFAPVQAPYAIAPPAPRVAPAAAPTPVAASAPLPPLAPLASAAPPAPPTPQSGSSSSTIRSTNGEVSADWRWRDGVNSREIRMNGHIEFTDDESDIQSMGPGAYFSFEEDHGFSSRRFQATADGSGGIKRQYLIDGHDHAIDDEARAWLRGTIPEAIRESGIDVSGRVRRLVQRGGASAVLAEIEKIHSSGVRTAYVRELLPAASLNTEQLQTLLRVARSTPGDGEKRVMLQLVARSVMKDNLRDYAFDAASTINSSGDRRVVLMSFIEADASQATLLGVAKSTQQMPSDGDKDVVLTEVARHYRSNETIRTAFFRAVETIQSSGDRDRVLTAVLENSGDHRETLIDVIHAAGMIPSDGDKRAVLMHAADHWKEDDAVRRAYFESAQRINSSGDLSAALLAVINRGGVSAATLTAGIQAAARIPADGNKRAVLMGAAEHWKEDDAVRRAYFDSAGKINSSGDSSSALLAVMNRAGVSAATMTAGIHASASIPAEGDRFRILMAAMERQDASTEVLIEATKAAATMNSESAIARLLLAAVNRSADKPALKSAIRDALRSLHSDSTYRAVMNALDRQSPAI